MLRRAAILGHTLSDLCQKFGRIWSSICSYFCVQVKYLTVIAASFITVLPGFFDTNCRNYVMQNEIMGWVVANIWKKVSMLRYIEDFLLWC